MFKIVAAILVFAVYMSPVVEGAAAGVAASASPVENLDPAQIDLYGYQIGLPLLAPDNGPLTTLLAAALPPRTYVAQSNPVLVRTALADNFIGESTIGIVAI